MQHDYLKESAPRQQQRSGLHYGQRLLSAESDRSAPTEQHPTGRWGLLHKRYLKEHHPIRYNQLLLSGELDGYLAKLDKQAEEQLALIIRQMQDAEGVTEALKAADQLEWVRQMNSILNRTEEIILREIVFNTYKNQAFA